MAGLGDFFNRANDILDSWAQKAGQLYEGGPGANNPHPFPRSVPPAEDPAVWRDPRLGGVRRGPPVLPTTPPLTPLPVGVTTPAPTGITFGNPPPVTSPPATPLGAPSLAPLAPGMTIPTSDARVPTLPQTPEAMAQVAQATRAARVAQYGEAAVAAMEKSGGIFTGAAPAAAGGALPPVSAVARALPTFASGYGALRTAAGAVAPWLAPAAEAVRLGVSALDPAQTAGETGLRGAMGAGRLAGLSLGAKLPLPGWGRAIAATAGYLAPDAAESVARWFRGDAAPTPAPVAPAPVPTTPLTDSPDYAAGFTPPAPVVAPVTPPVAPFTSADIDSNRVPERGMGAFRNNRTGVVTNLDTREVGPAAAPQMVSASQYDIMRGGTPMPNGGIPDTRPQPFRGTPAATFFNAGMQMKTIANDNAQRAGYAKLLTDLAQHRGVNDTAMAGHVLTANAAAAKLAAEAPGLGATAGLHTAQAEEIKTLQAGAMAHLAAHPGDYQGAMAILGKHAGPVPHLQVPIGIQPTTPDPTNPTANVFDPATGAIRKTPITQRATAANVDAALAGSMKGKTRAQVIQAYKDKGFDVTGLQ